MRLAWFSPFPPVRTGIAGVSAAVVEALRRRGHEVDPYPEASAHDFVWRRRLAPYDLVVYQFGNSSHHDYEWAYALNFPGLVVLHDTHLHHARAAQLLRERRVDDYRAEFSWNHPDVPPDVAELAVAGFDSRLYYDWPMVRGLVAASRLVAVHGDATRRELIESLAADDRWSMADGRCTLSERIVSIRLGHGHLVSPQREIESRRRVRSRYTIAEDAVLFGVFGGLTPEKRLPQILSAFRAVLPYAPDARLLFGGAPASHYDIAGAVSAEGLTDHVTLTGYLEQDDDLTDHIAACDVTLNLRWPTARETSGPWLQGLAAGRATIITDLAHMTDLASLDPRTWAVNEAGCAMRDARATSQDDGQTPEHASRIAHRASTPVCVAIDIVDEDHSLRLAMRRLATDGALRTALGRAAQEWWAREHSLEAMVDDYERVLVEAAARPAEDVPLPGHMRNPGDRKLRELVRSFDLETIL